MFIPCSALTDLHFPLISSPHFVSLHLSFQFDNVGGGHILILEANIRFAKMTVLPLIYKGKKKLGFLDIRVRDLLLCA